jgi:phenylacetate-CoA ligase
MTTQTMDRDALAARQGERLLALLHAVHGRNAFYTRKLDAAGVDPRALRLPEDLTRLPFTTKAEFVADQQAHAPWGTNLTERLDAYTRYCQTSSTTGQPLRWLDTNASWQWMLDCWKAVYQAAHIGVGDRVFFPFSFGPFLGFWAGFEAGSQVGLHCVPGGGMSTHVRLTTIADIQPTVVCCTPTYALRLAEVAANDWPAGGLAGSSVRALIVSGEPGGNIPATRARIEAAWGARVLDHHGLTEVGPISFECWESPGSLHLNEEAFICEVVDAAAGGAVADGHPGELVVTNLGRVASPAIRYRTGDIVVRKTEPCACGRTFARLDGGIRTRSDDMVNVRGVNVYPAAIESVVREFPDIVEFRAVVARAGALRHLSVEVEVAGGAAQGVEARLAHRLREALGLTTPVAVVSAGTLPRFEMKARRFVVEG